MLFSRHAFTSSTAIAASSALFASTFIAAATSANEAGNVVDAGILALSPSSSRVGENRRHGIFGEERALQGLCSTGSYYVECDKGKLASDNTIDCATACYNNDSGKYDCCDGDYACNEFTGKICRDGSCNGNSTCEYATIPLVDESCKGDQACYAVGYVANGDANKVGNFIGSCNANKACFEIAKYVEGGGAGNIENSCNFYLACAALGQVKNAGGPVTSNLKDCCNSDKACYEYNESMIPAECKVEPVTPEPSAAPTSKPSPKPSPKQSSKPSQGTVPGRGPKAGKNTKLAKTIKPTPARVSAPPSKAKTKSEKKMTANLF